MNNENLFVALIFREAFSSVTSSTKNQHGFQFTQFYVLPGPISKSEQRNGSRVSRSSPFCYNFTEVAFAS